MNRMIGAGFFHRVAAITVLLQGLVATGIAQTTEPAPRVSAELVSVAKIWDQAPHNAFTDLIHWKGKFYCAFREGKGHAGDLGKLRVLASVDGENWNSAGLIEDAKFDLRDAALTEMPDGRLMVLGGAQIPGKSTGTFVCFSEDGVQFSAPEIVIAPGRWLWRTTRQGEDSFGVAYGAPERANASSLLKTRDGRNYETVVSDLLNDGEWPTEARI
ncbi:MAG: exo-alpha-sialidase, partial [Planctomycetaceae bacterium]|nr:exo-alpha-sialidase [Planctomycetaceae bacterium]